MDENTKRRHSVYENVEKIKQSAKRRSMFEISNQTTQEKENMNSKMEEWNRRWGHHNTDYVNVATYPEDSVRKINDEIEMWSTGLTEMIEKAEEFGYKTEGIEVIKECELSAEQKASLQDIDSKISTFITQSKACLETLEASKNLQELRLEEINREINLVEKLIVLKDKNYV